MQEQTSRGAPQHNVAPWQVNNNFPCVSMMDWRGRGSDTARTWALQMTIDILGNDEKRVFPATITGVSAGRGPAGRGGWPLPSVVYSIGFRLASVRRVPLCTLLYGEKWYYMGTRVLASRYGIR